MERNRKMDEDTWLVLDDTTIYEVDLECYRNMSEEERRAAGLELAESDHTQGKYRI